MRLKILTLSTLLASCGNTGFLGKDRTKAAEPSPITTSRTVDALDPSVVGPSSVEGGTVVLEAPTDAEKVSIDSCAKAWGVTPSISFDKVRKIYANVSVAGRGVTLLDNAQTTTPSLTLLYASVNVGGTPIWELTNPNGWYCIVVSVQVATELTIRLAESAHLADSNVAVNVGSSTDEAIGTIGVHVGSETTVERL